MVSLRTCTGSRRCSGGSRRCSPMEIRGRMWCRRISSEWSCWGWDRRRMRVGWRRRGCALGASSLRRNWRPRNYSRDWGEGTLVVATSASGGSAETLDALERLPHGVHTVALTNTAGSAIAKRCRSVVELAAEPEVGGVACRSYQHTLALLLALECQLVGYRLRRARARSRFVGGRERVPAGHRE